MRGAASRCGHGKIRRCGWRLSAEPRTSLTRAAAVDRRRAALRHPAARMQPSRSSLLMPRLGAGWRAALTGLSEPQSACRPFCVPPRRRDGARALPATRAVLCRCRPHHNLCGTGTPISARCRVCHRGRPSAQARPRDWDRRRGAPVIHIARCRSRKSREKFSGVVAKLIGKKNPSQRRTQTVR